MALQKALNHVHPGRNPLAFHLLLSVAFFLSFYLVSARFLIIMGRFCSPLLPSTGWVMMQDLHALVQQPPPPLSVVFLGFGAVVHSWHRLGPAKDAAWHHLWDAVRLEPSLSVSSPQAGASITLHSARFWDEFSSVSSKTIPELRNPQPINPGKLCRPKVFEVCSDYLPAMAVNLYFLQVSALLSGLWLPAPRYLKRGGHSSKRGLPGAQP